MAARWRSSCLSVDLVKVEGLRGGSRINTLSQLTAQRGQRVPGWGHSHVLGWQLTFPVSCSRRIIAVVEKDIGAEMTEDLFCVQH